ncbi:hypothetical protein LDENG_00120170 [Lucifuga dentata]|nr:hypothetical protein LDENG_00120170 [Lucifuga dentata]
MMAHVPTTKEVSCVSAMKAIILYLTHHLFVKILMSVSTPPSVVLTLCVSTHLELIPVNVRWDTSQQTQPQNPAKPTSVLMNALRHQAYVEDKQCVVMLQGASIVPVLMDSSLQLESCGSWGSHFVKIFKIFLMISNLQRVRQKRELSLTIWTNN